jgi:tRNA dimethylallyltransferase
MPERVPITTPVIVLVGPTAIGKTDLSLKLADEFGCEIISMDSMQVYRYMDIGTAKVSREEQQHIAHHLIDIVDPDEQYDASSFVRDAMAAVKIITARGKIPFITGGTGLYLSSLINGLFDTIKVNDEIRSLLRERLDKEGREALHQELLRVDPKSGTRIHVNDTQRLLRGLEIFLSTGTPWSEHLRRQALTRQHPTFTRMLQLGLTCEREALYERIKIRSISMMQDAFQQEFESLLAKGFERNLPSMQSIGYRHMGAFLAGECDRETATANLIRDTRRYAKRQMTWFRRQQQLQWHDIRITDRVFIEVAAFLHTENN